jgi:hypothetical protein
MLALICLTLGCIEFYGSTISGVEFSPDSFTQRKFSYRRSPFTGAIRGKRILTAIDSDCDSLIALNLIPSGVPTASNRWDLVSESLQTGDVLSADFDARFLTEYLDDATDQWNRTNVKKAEMLWPEIAMLVREQLYLPLPSLFHFAINSPDELSDEQFEQRLHEQLAKAWFQAANITAVRAQLGDESDGSQPPASVADAKRFLKRATRLNPGYENAMQLEMPLQESALNP